MLSLYNQHMAKSRNSMSDLVDDMWGSIDLTFPKSRPGYFATNSTTASTTTGKSYKSIESNEGLKLTVDLPGVDPNSIELERSGSVVALFYTSSSGRREERRFSISEKYDCETARGTYALGQVTIQIDAMKPVEKPPSTKLPFTIK